MPLQGNLKEMSLANLIQVNCQEMRSARLTLASAGQSGEVYFSDGQVVHAVMGKWTGEPAVFEMLAWDDGIFTLDRDQSTPDKTIDMPWNALLLEGMKRLAERPVARATPKDKPKSNMLKQFKEIDGVGGVVIASSDGVVLGVDIPGSDGEGEAAVAVFMGAASGQLGEALALGGFSHSVVSLKQKRLLVLHKNERYIGLVLNENVSPTIVANAAKEIFK